MITHLFTLACVLLACQASPINPHLGLYYPPNPIYPEYHHLPDGPQFLAYPPMYYLPGALPPAARDGYAPHWRDSQLEKILQLIIRPSDPIQLEQSQSKMENAEKEEFCDPE